MHFPSIDDIITIDERPPLVLPNVLEAKKGGPKPPGFNPRWKKQGKEWVDPKTGTRWHYHPEDSGHYSHWDVRIPGKGKIRIPIDSQKGVFK